VSGSIETWNSIQQYFSVLSEAVACQKCSGYRSSRRVSSISVPGVEVVLTASDLRRRWMTSIQELLNYLINVQDPPHQAVHLLVQALKPRKAAAWMTV